jgi:lipoprotein NlpD
VANPENLGQIRLICRLVPVLFAMLIAGCFAPESSPPQRGASGGITPGGSNTRTHTVMQGETIYAIARQYGVTPSRLMAANSIEDSRHIYVGEVLLIPQLATGMALGVPDVWSVPRADRQFGWPVRSGVVSSPFGMRNGVLHEGIDIAAPMGTPVLAADAGEVIFAGVLRGYGNVVIVRHSESYVTVYGHNRRNLVSAGERVLRGQEIAEIGNSGRTRGPNLHFEVRFENHPQNPIAYLPAPGPADTIRFARNVGG